MGCNYVNIGKNVSSTLWNPWHEEIMAGAKKYGVLNKMTS